MCKITVNACSRALKCLQMPFQMIVKGADSTRGPGSDSGLGKGPGPGSGPDPGSGAGPGYNPGLANGPGQRSGPWPWQWPWSWQRPWPAWKRSLPCKWPWTAKGLQISEVSEDPECVGCIQSIDFQMVGRSFREVFRKVLICFSDSFQSMLWTAFQSKNIIP